MSPKQIGVIIGSLRKESASRKLAEYLRAIAPKTLNLSLIDIGRLPHYNEDLETSTPPAEWVDFRKALLGVDGVLFVTPEYNRSVSGVLKNAVDVGSRPYGQNAWAQKPGAVISVSMGALGGFGANHHLRQSLVCLDVPLLQQPEAYIGGATKLFDENGKMQNPQTAEFLQNFMGAYASWVFTLANRSKQ